MSYSQIPSWNCHGKDFVASLFFSMNQSNAKPMLQNQLPKNTNPSRQLTMLTIPDIAPYVSVLQDYNTFMT